MSEVSPAKPISHTMLWTMLTLAVLLLYFGSVPLVEAHYYSHRYHGRIARRDWYEAPWWAVHYFTPLKHPMENYVQWFAKEFGYPNDLMFQSSSNW